MFENLGNFLKRMVKTEQQKELGSKDAAKERLHLVLMQDRANVSADFLELMKQEIIDVIKKYIVVDEDSIDVRLTNQPNEEGITGAPSLYANIPIVNIKNDMMAEKIKEFEGIDFNKEMGIPTLEKQEENEKDKKQEENETPKVIELSEDYSQSETEKEESKQEMKDTNEDIKEEQEENGTENKEIKEKQEENENETEDEDVKEMFEEIDDDDDVTFDDLLKAAEEAEKKEENKSENENSNNNKSKSKKQKKNRGKNN